MPSSDWTYVSDIVDVVMRLRPQSLLDIGAGSGKYGVLLREYLEQWSVPELRQQHAYAAQAWTHRIDAVEGFEPYITPLHHYVYDRVIVDDALHHLATLAACSYDCVLLIDVLEHFDAQHGSEVLRHCRRIARWTIVTTPRRFWPQPAVHGNELEVHRMLWSRTMLRREGARYFVPHRHAHIAVLGEPLPKQPAPSLTASARAATRTILRKAFATPLYRRFAPRLNPYLRRIPRLRKLLPLEE